MYSQEFEQFMIEAFEFVGEDGWHAIALRCAAWYRSRQNYQPVFSDRLYGFAAMYRYRNSQNPPDYARYAIAGNWFPWMTTVQTHPELG